MAPAQLHSSQHKTYEAMQVSSHHQFNYPLPQAADRLDPCSHSLSKMPLYSKEDWNLEDYIKALPTKQDFESFV